jgi:hypothetical protein
MSGRIESRTVAPSQKTLTSSNFQAVVTPTSNSSPPSTTPAPVPAQAPVGNGSGSK